MYPSAGSSLQVAHRDRYDRHEPHPHMPSELPTPGGADDQQLHAAHYAYYADGSPSYGHSQYYATVYAPPPSQPSKPDPGLAYSYGQQPDYALAPAPQSQHSVFPYSHDRTFAAVESARWTGAMDSPTEMRQPVGLPPTAGAQAGPAWTDNDARRWSTASSGYDSGDSPLIGTMALPFEDDLAGPPPEIKPFVQKLWDMLSDPQHFQDVILWNRAGDAFFVAHNDRFISEVLPSAFGHSNVHSFTRQLNVYNFQRMNVAQLRSALDLQGGIAGAYSGWSHAQFRRGDASTLALLVPRPSRARLIRKLEKQYGGSGTSSNSSSSSGSSSAAAIGPPSATSARLANPPPLHEPQPQAPPTYYSQLDPDSVTYP